MLGVATSTQRAFTTLEVGRSSGAGAGASPGHGSCDAPGSPVTPSLPPVSAGFLLWDLRTGFLRLL